MYIWPYSCLYILLCHITCWGKCFSHHDVSLSKDFRSFHCPVSNSDCGAHLGALIRFFSYLPVEHQEDAGHGYLDQHQDKQQNEELKTSEETNVKERQVLGQGDCVCRQKLDSPLRPCPYSDPTSICDPPLGQQCSVMLRAIESSVTDDGFPYREQCKR